MCSAPPSRFPRAPNPLSLPFQTPATQARRLRGPEGVVVVQYVCVLTQLSRGSISVGLHSQQSICQATLLIDIIHLPNLFHTSRFNQLLNPDRERYFFMKDAGHILRVNVAERKRGKSHPPSPVPQFEPRVRTVVYARYCIHYCQQPAVILRNVLITVLEATTHYRCKLLSTELYKRAPGILATKGSLFELKSG